VAINATGRTQRMVEHHAPSPQPNLPFAAASSVHASAAPRYIDITPGAIHRLQKLALEFGVNTMISLNICELGSIPLADASGAAVVICAHLHLPTTRAVRAGAISKYHHLGHIRKHRKVTHSERLHLNLGVCYAGRPLCYGALRTTQALPQPWTALWDGWPTTQQKPASVIGWRTRRDRTVTARQTFADGTQPWRACSPRITTSGSKAPSLVQRQCG
jgi:hypothetical protein